MKIWSHYDRYTVVYKCVKCQRELTFGQKVDRHGVCPYCGYTKGGTVCRTEQSSKKVRDYYWCGIYYKSEDVE